MSEDGLELVKFVDENFELEVNVSPKENTVWLTQSEISQLFNRERSVITKHIRNIFSEHECEEKSNVHFLHIPGSDKPVEAYSLDVIISIGYRVKSQRGIVFRRWATDVLRQYLIQGYALNNARILVSKENYISLVNVVNDMKDSQIRLENRVEKLEAKLPELTNKLFFDGQLWDATSCIESIFTGAKNSIVLIDNYSDTQTLDMLSKKKSDVSVILVTDKRTSRLTQKEVSAFNTQYGKLSIFYSKDFHDRFIIVDNATLYHCGASIKDAGRKTFAINRIDDSDYLQALLQIADPFYSPKNQRFLKESIKSLKAGKGIKHDLIEPDGTELHGPFNSIEELMEDLNSDD